jgi:pimeloyl-ACP methyl ester carboxylesterase
MDVLRAVLGDARLHYLGKSYGTFLGATYAQEFPKNVGRMVLDGAIDPALSSEQVNLGQAKGFEQATRSFVADCVKGRSCPLGSDTERGMARLRALLTQLDASPLPTSDPARPLTEGLGSLGVAVAMYDQGYWPTLRAALAQAFGGDGTALLQLSDLYTDRDGRGHYATNQNTVIYAVNCLDRPYRGPADPVAEARRDVTTFSKQAPTRGAFLAWSEVPCAYWPVKPKEQPTALTAAGSGPIVVVGTTRDPATPYAWAKGLAGELANGHLLTYVGDGHTAYRRGSRCIDKAVDAYLLRGDVPKAGLRCD